MQIRSNIMWLKVMLMLQWTVSVTCFHTVWLQRYTQVYFNIQVLNTTHWVLFVVSTLHLTNRPGICVHHSGVELRKQNTTSYLIWLKRQIQLLHSLLKGETRFRAVFLKQHYVTISGDRQLIHPSVHPSIICPQLFYAGLRRGGSWHVGVELWVVATLASGLSSRRLRHISQFSSHWQSVWTRSQVIYGRSEWRSAQSVGQQGTERYLHSLITAFMIITQNQQGGWVVTAD